MKKIKIPILHMVLLGFFLLMAGMAFISSNMFDENYFEFAKFQIDNVPVHMAVLVVLLAGCYLRQKVNMNRQAQNLVNGICLLWGIVFPLIFTYLWAKQCAYVPVWDPEYVCNSALAMVEGRSFSTEQLFYLEKYPHQMGFVWFLSIVLRMFGSGGRAFLHLHYAYAGMIVGILLCGLALLKQLKMGDTVVRGYLLLAGACFPLFIYVNFLYSDIPGIFFLMLSIVLFGKAQQKENVFFSIGGTLMLAVSVLVRKNNLIPVIAFLCVFAYKAMIEKKKETVAGIILLLAVTLGAPVAVNNGLCLRYGISQEKAEPSITWIAMGMQESRFGSGWFNGYVDEIYKEKSGNPQQIAEVSKAEIHQQLQEYLHNPKHGLSFFLHKMMIQWNQPSYQCLGVSKTYEKMPGGMVEAIYSGSLFALFRGIFDCYQWVLYLGTFFYMYKNKKEGVPTILWILLVTVLGGFLFSLLWEAKSRYILPYMVLLLPLAAAGYGQIFIRNEQ